MMEPNLNLSMNVNQDNDQDDLFIRVDDFKRDATFNKKSFKDEVNKPVGGDRSHHHSMAMIDKNFLLSPVLN